VRERLTITIAPAALRPVAEFFGFHDRRGRWNSLKWWPGRGRAEVAGSQVIRIPCAVLLDTA
jgi:hypothetical protein